MNLTEVDEIIEYFNKYIPKGKTKEIILKTSLIIHDYIKNFKNSNILENDLTNFDEIFYGYICNIWVEDIVFYTIDEPHEAFKELFKDFRLACHRSIINNFTENTKQNTECVY